MDGVGGVAVVALGVICVAQQWALTRLVARLLPPQTSQYRAASPRASQGRTGTYEEQRHYRHHPSDDTWTIPGASDDRS